MKKYFKKFIILISLIVILVLPYVVSAASPALNNLRTTGQGGSGAGKPPYELTDRYTFSKIINTVIQAFLGLLGIIFLVLIIYAGYNWMTAQGDEEKVTKAKDTLQRAVIGLIIITVAYSITFFVFSSLPGGSGEGSSPIGGSSP